MGQRSQIYIRYNNGKNMVARHLQWNYGFYMINRAYQILDYLNKHCKYKYNNFTPEEFEFSNRDRDDLDILKTLIEYNFTIGSVVRSCDLFKEEYEYHYGKEEKPEKIKIDPYWQDNNNGMLYVDIQGNNNEDFKIKYAFNWGDEDNSDTTSLITAEQYYSVFKEYDYEHHFDEEDKKEIEKQIAFIDSFELMSKEEFKNMFDTEYESCNVVKGVKAQGGENNE